VDHIQQRRVSSIPEKTLIEVPPERPDTLATPVRGTSASLPEFWPEGATRSDFTAAHPTIFSKPFGF
jgi:hypothetical protein